jgi:hypothetical protein
MRALQERTPGGCDVASRCRSAASVQADLVDAQHGPLMASEAKALLAVHVKSPQCA